MKSRQFVLLYSAIFLVISQAALTACSSLARSVPPKSRPVVDNPSNEIAWSEADGTFAARIVDEPEKERAFQLNLHTGMSRLSDSYDDVFGIKLVENGKLEFFARKGSRVQQIRDFTPVREWDQADGPKPPELYDRYWKWVEELEKAPFSYLESYMQEKQGERELKILQCGWQVCAQINGKLIASFEGMGRFGFPRKNMTSEALHGLAFSEGTKTLNLSHETGGAGVYEIHNDFSGTSASFLVIQWPAFTEQLRKTTVFLMSADEAIGNPKLLRVLGISPANRTPGVTSSAYLLVEPGSGDGCPGPVQWVQLTERGESASEGYLSGCSGSYKVTRKYRTIGKLRTLHDVSDYRVCMDGKCQRLTIDPYPDMK